MRLVFAGTPDTAIPSLNALAASRHELIAVITRPDAPSGRGRAVMRSPVGTWADERGIPVLTPGSAREPALRSALVDLAPDCCPVVAYGAILPAGLLDVPLHGWVNLHFSLLPAWRGAAPVQWAILRGDDLTGATTFRIGAGLDDGPVLGTMTESIRSDDTSGTLLDRLAHAGAGLLLQTMDAIEEGRVTPVEQPSDGVSHAPKISADDARVRWSEPALSVDRRIRAVTPEPGAWTLVDDTRLGLGPVTHGRAPEPLGPGELLAEKAAVWVGTATTAVRLGLVRPAGRRPMPAADWARGTRRQRMRLA